MRYIVYIIVVVLLLALESSFFAILGSGSFYPNLLLLSVIAIALSFENLDYLFIGAIGGIMFDIYYGLPIGSFAVPLVLSGFLVTSIIRKWLFSDITGRHFIFIVILATVLMYLWLGIYTQVLFYSHWSVFSLDWHQLFRKIPWSIAANLLLAYPIYVSVEALARWSQRFGAKQIKLK